MKNDERHEQHEVRRQSGFLRAETGKANELEKHRTEFCGGTNEKCTTINFFKFFSDFTGIVHAGNCILLNIIIVLPTTKIHVVDTKNIRVKMSSHSVAVHEGHVPHASPDIQEALSNIEHYLADIRANLLLFEETHDICMGLRDILDSCTRPDGL